MNKFRLRTIILIISALLLAPAAYAEEEVLKFETSVQIKSDKTIKITESLVVRVEGKQIKKGLIRALPLFVEKEKDAVPFHINYTINSVKRDGKKANFQQQTTPRLLILRIFDSGVFLDHGDHTFTISYTISGYQFHDPEVDSFYWHVTGHGWPLPINLAEAQIAFPPLVDPHTVIASAHTGTLEEPTFETVVHRVRSGGVHYSALTPIDDGGGLTIKATWARGFFKTGELLSVPTDEKITNSDENLLTVPDGGATALSSETVAKLDPRLFKPDIVEQIFAEVRIEPTGDIVVTESIRTRSDGKLSQGLLRTIPLHQKVTGEYAFVGEQELQLESAATTNSFFLVAPAPLPDDSHTFVLQYRIPAVITRHQIHDELNFSLGDPLIGSSIGAAAVKLYPPELMLPVSGSVTASVPDHPDQVIETEVLEDSVLVTLVNPLPPRSNLNVKFKLPKGFIH